MFRLTSLLCLAAVGPTTKKLRNLNATSKAILVGIGVRAIVFSPHHPAVDEIFWKGRIVILRNFDLPLQTKFSEEIRNKLKISEGHEGTFETFWRSVLGRSNISVQLQGLARIFFWEIVLALWSFLRGLAVKCPKLFWHYQTLACWTCVWALRAWTLCPCSLVGAGWSGGGGDKTVTNF